MDRSTKKGEEITIFLKMGGEGKAIMWKGRKDEKVEEIVERIYKI